MRSRCRLDLGVAVQADDGRKVGLGHGHDRRARTRCVRRPACPTRPCPSVRLTMRPMTGFASSGPLVVVWSVLNSIAWRWGSTQALPFGTVIALIVIYALSTAPLSPRPCPRLTLQHVCSTLPCALPIRAVGFPLTVIGSIIGKNRAGSFDAPCRTRNIPREIPAAPWYHSAIAQLLMAGFLPFRCCDGSRGARTHTVFGRGGRLTPGCAKPACVPAQQCHLHRAVLHLCDRVGPQAVHALRHPPDRLCDLGDRHLVHHRRAHLLPALRGGLPLVVAVHHERRVRKGNTQAQTRGGVRVGRAGSGEQGRASRVGRAGSGEQGRASRVGRAGSGEQGWAMARVSGWLASFRCRARPSYRSLLNPTARRSPPGPAAGPIPSRPCSRADPRPALQPAHPLSEPCSPPILCQNPALATLPS